MTVPMMPEEPLHDHPTGAHRRKIAELQSRLAESEDTLRAIRSGEVDAITVTTSGGQQVFSLSGAEQPYREMIEAMSEGAVNVTPDVTELSATDAVPKPIAIARRPIWWRISPEDRTRITMALGNYGTTRASIAPAVTCAGLREAQARAAGTDQRRLAKSPAVGTRLTEEASGCRVINWSDVRLLGSVHRT